MKILLLCLVFALACGTLAFAQTTNSAPANTPAPTTGSGDRARAEKLKAALARLDLSDAQKAQIKQIRATVTDRKERRQQIMALLTPAQKQKLLQMIQEHRSAEASGSAPSGT